MNLNVIHELNFIHTVPDKVIDMYLENISLSSAMVFLGFLLDGGEV